MSETHSSTKVPYSRFFPCVAIACGQTLVIRRPRDGYSRVLQQSHPDFSWSVRFNQNGRYISSGGDLQEDRIKILNVRKGKCLVRHAGGDVDVVRGLVFTPDGKGLLSCSSWDTWGPVLAQINLRRPEGRCLNGGLDWRSEGNLTICRSQSASIF